MPNWFSTNLTFKGDKEKVKEIVKFVQGLCKVSHPEFFDDKYSILYRKGMIYESEVELDWSSVLKQKPSWGLRVFWKYGGDHITFHYDTSGGVYTEWVIELSTKFPDVLIHFGSCGDACMPLTNSFDVQNGKVRDYEEGENRWWEDQDPEPKPEIDDDLPF